MLYSFRVRETTNVDLWVTPLEGDQASRPFLDSRFNETHGQFSPDGQWVAYESDASGRSEIYVTPFPGPGGVQIISTAGGVQPRWRGDGEVLELFFLRPDNTLMAVTLEPSADGSRLIPGTPEALFVTRIAGGAAQPLDIGHRRRFPNGVRLKVPERRTGLCIDRHQRTAVLAEEHQAADGGERAAPGIDRSGLRQLPRDVAGQDVDRAQNLLPRLAGWGPRGPTVIRTGSSGTQTPRASGVLIASPACGFSRRSLRGPWRGPTAPTASSSLASSQRYSCWRSFPLSGIRAWPGGVT